MPNRAVLITALAFAAAPALGKSTVEVWQAMSNTAMSITGTIRLSPTGLKAGKAVFPLRVAADVKNFEAGTRTYPARILEITKPMDPRLLNGNKLCGAGPAQWLVVYREQKDQLGMSVFSTGPRPIGDKSPNLCGTYGYSR